jgi:hypothetical protein
LVIGSEPTAIGVGFVLLGAIVGVAVSFVLRTRAPAPAVAVLLVGAGASIGVGGMLLQPDPSAFESMFTVAALAVLVPFHVRVVFGPFGPPRRRGGPRGTGGRTER